VDRKLGPADLRLEVPLGLAEREHKIGLPCIDE
jgi:hypothetical protein